MASILVCTRREDMLGELGALLRGEHQVAIVPRVADVVRSLLLTRTDAVVLDVDAELAHHPDILRVIARLNPRIPLLIVSDPAWMDAEAALRAAGIFRFLVRPLSPGELERHLAAALRRRAAEPSPSAGPRHADPTGTLAR